MLKQQARLVALMVFSLDLVLVGVSFFAAHWLRGGLFPRLWPVWFSGPLYPLERYLPMLPLALVVWAAALIATGRYRSHRTVTLAIEAAAIIRVAAIATVVLVLAIFALRIDVWLLDGDRMSRTLILLSGALSCLLLVAEKVGLRITSRWVRQLGFNYRTLLIVGTNRVAVAVAKSIAGHRYWGFRLAGFLRSPEEQDAAPGDLSAPLLGSIDDLPAVLESHVIDDVIFAVTPRELGSLERHFLSLQEQGIGTRFALNLLPGDPPRIHLEDLDGLPLLSVARAPTNLPLLLTKRLLDVALAALLLAIGLPVILVIAMLIKASSTGSVFYRQTRCGLNGRRFTLYKFRTMVMDAEERRQELLHLNEMDGPAFKVRRDPRVTAFGRLLRKFSLDELPQLWNVIRGEMSLVGPRPPIPEEVAQYSRPQRRRLSMKPGLTCLWQISGRNNIDFDRWMELDLEYIDSWSPWLDLKILLRTIPVVLSGRGAS